jgi:hypothetical protein
MPCPNHSTLQIRICALGRHSHLCWERLARLNRSVTWQLRGKLAYSLWSCLLQRPHENG